MTDLSNRKVSKRRNRMSTFDNSHHHDRGFFFNFLRIVEVTRDDEIKLECISNRRITK